MKHRIKLLRIKNILNIEELEVRPGALTIAEGPNDTGKTSFLRAVQAFAGGHDGTLLRHGAEEGEAVLILDDDVELRTTVRKGGTERAVERADGGKRSAPQRWLNSKIDALGFNPVEFLEPPGARTPEAKAKKQVEMLLESAHIELEWDDLAPRLPASYADSLTTENIEGRHALTVLSEVHDELYDERRGVNRLIREQEGHIAQLEKAVDPELELDDQPHATVEAFEAKLNDLERRRKKEIDEVKQRVAQGAKEIHRDTEAAIQERQKKIDELERQIQALDREREDDLAELRTERADQVGAINASYAEKSAGVREQLATAKERARSYDHQAETVQELEKARKQLAARQENSRILTESLESLDELRAELFERLPLDGLEIRDAMLYRGKTPFHRLNDEKRVKAALNLAAHRAGDIGIVCIDGLEKLDPDNYEAFIAAMKERDDVQFFATRVTGGEFRIRTEG